MKRIVMLILAGILCCGLLPAFADGYSDYDTGDYMASPYVGSIAVVVSKSVTVRTEPSYDGKTVYSAKNGEILRVVGESGNWTQVIGNKNGMDVDGWVITSYIVIQPMTITLRSSNIPAYCAPDKRSKLVGSLPKGTELTVLGTWEDFYIVNLREASAFISMDADVWTSKELYMSVYQSGRQVLTVRDTRMRSGPGTEWQELARIPAGQLLTAGEIYEGWIVVNYNGMTGFIPQTDVNLSYYYYDDGGNG